MSFTKVYHASTDPICTRVSVGGNEEIGYYCVYRGSLKASITALQKALAEMQKVHASGTEPIIDPTFKRLPF